MNLREKYPQLNIPKYPRTENKEALRKLLALWKERAHAIENKQKNLKGYLYIVIFGIQFFFSKFLRFDNLSGFFEDQMFFIEKYEVLIDKISEKYRTIKSVISVLEPEKDTKIEVLEKNPEIKLVFYLIFYSIVIIIIRQFLRHSGLQGNSQNGIGNLIKNKILSAISGKESLFDIGLLNSFIDPQRRNGIVNTKPESASNANQTVSKNTKTTDATDRTMRPKFEE